MKQSFIVIAFLLFCFLRVFSQGQYVYKPTPYTVSLPEEPELRKTLLNDSLSNSLNQFQKDLVYYINYVRLYPKAFCTGALDPYLRAYPDLKPKYGLSLRQQLLTSSSIAIVLPEKRLINAASFHSNDLAKHRLMSHSSSDGTTMQNRFTRFGISFGSECVNLMPPSGPLDVLLALLVDFNIPDYGHRTILLNSELVTIGVGAKSSLDGMQYTVLDFGCKSY